MSHSLGYFFLLVSFSFSVCWPWPRVHACLPSQAMLPSPLARFFFTGIGSDIGIGIGIGTSGFLASVDIARVGKVF